MSGPSSLLKITLLPAGFTRLVSIGMTMTMLMKESLCKMDSMIAFVALSFLGLILPVRRLLPKATCMWSILRGSLAAGAVQGRRDVWLRIRNGFRSSLTLEKSTWAGNGFTSGRIRTQLITTPNKCPKWYQEGFTLLDIRLRISLWTLTQKNQFQKKSLRFRVMFGATARETPHVER